MRGSKLVKRGLHHPAQGAGRKAPALAAVVVGRQFLDLWENEQKGVAHALGGTTTDAAHVGNLQKAETFG